MADAQLSGGRHNEKDVLLRTDEGFQHLVSEHHALDERIRQLSGLTHLTDEQLYEETSLKKRKLALKDRIEAMLRGRSGGVMHAPQH